MSKQENTIQIQEGESIKVVMEENTDVYLKITCQNNQLYVENISLKTLEDIQYEEEQVNLMKEYLKERTKG